MKSISIKIPLLIQALFLVFTSRPGISQGLDEPLTFQGLNHASISSAGSRAQAGTTIGIKNDPGTMFANPASLQSLQGIQLSIGGLGEFTALKQVQQYSPLKYYPNFSLLMEGLTDYIGDPQYDTSKTYSPGDSVQRPFDDIGPNWDHKKNHGLPLQAMIGVPFSIGGMNFAVGIGTIEYANLYHFYQNNNVLSPHIGSARPVWLPRPSLDSLSVQWYQYNRTRDGSVSGYGGVLSAAITEQLSVGTSAMILSGSSDDWEQHIGRGRLMFFSNSFRLDSVYDHTSKTGTSDYSGSEVTLSSIYRGKFVALSVTAKLPTTITRKFKSDIQTDTTGIPVLSQVSGEDKMKLPWRGTFGLSLILKDNLTCNLEYDIHQYNEAVYTDGNGGHSNPWLSSNNIRIGSEFQPYSWLAIRAGVRHESEVFGPVGDALIGDPVSYTVYSLGCGIESYGVHLNLVYEYSLLKYQDIWQTNVNLNQASTHVIAADIVYELPFKF